ncbi:MAG: hypothetical protein WCI88_01735 [Chloroflexota bacterium]
MALAGTQTRPSCKYGFLLSQMGAGTKPAPALQAEHGKNMKLKRSGVKIDIQSVRTAAGIPADWRFCGGRISSDGTEIILDFEGIPFRSFTFSHPHSQAHTECLRQAFQGFIKFHPPVETGAGKKQSIQDYLTNKKVEDKICASES